MHHLACGRMDPTPGCRPPCHGFQATRQDDLRFSDCTVSVIQILDDADVAFRISGAECGPFYPRPCSQTGRIVSTCFDDLASGYRTRGGLPAQRAIAQRFRAMAKMLLRRPLYFWMRIGSETDMPNSVNRAVSGAYNSLRLSSTSPAESSVCNGRSTARQSLTGAAVSNWRAHKSQTCAQLYN